MGDILAKASGLVFFIILAYFLKTVNVFKNSDKDFLGNILITINLPCVIISGFRTFAFDNSLVYAVILGLLANVIGVMIGYFLNSRKTKEEKVLYMMSTGGYNIGIFTIPFISGFLSSEALIGVLMFDIGNAVMVFGGAAAITTALISSEKTNPIPGVVKKLLKSPPFVTYIIMIFLIAFKVKIPEQLYIVSDIGAYATSYLAMIMIGIMLELKVPKDEVREVISIIFMRYSYSIIMAVLFYFLPFSFEIRKALIIVVLSPISTASVVFSQKLGCKPSLVGVVSSISIFISMILIVGIIIIL